MASILDETDLKNLNDALAMAVTAEEDLTRAEQAGIDVAGPRERLTATTAKIRKVKSAFFPNE